MHFLNSGLEFNETIVLAELCVPWAVLPPHHFCQFNSRKKDQVCNHLEIVSHFIFLSSFTKLRNHTRTPGCLPVHGLLASFLEVYRRKQEMHTVELRASVLKEGNWKEQPHTHIHTHYVWIHVHIYLSVVERAQKVGQPKPFNVTFVHYFFLAPINNGKFKMIMQLEKRAF